MHICNYCGRVLKHDYEKCPGCGGSSFKNKAYLGEEIIKTPPKDGYKINLENYKKEIKNLKTVILILVVILSIDFLLSLPFAFVAFFGDMGSIAFLGGAGVTFFVFLIIIIFQINGIKKLKEKMKAAEKLAKYGVLVKNIPYQVYKNGQSVSECLKLIYKNSAGVEKPLFSEPKHDLKEKMKNDDTADLLIDPEDYSNYFIDFEIY